MAASSSSGSTRGGDRRVRAQRFSSEGARKGPELALNATEGFHEAPKAICLVDGNYVVAWRSDPALPGGGVVTFRIFDFEGTPTRGETIPNLSGFRGEQALTVLVDGGFVIVHVRRLGVSDLGVDESAVEAHVFDASGNGGAVAFGLGGGRHVNVSSPAVSPLSNGRFLAAWLQKSADTFATTPSVRARVFSGGVEPVGPEVVISGEAAESRVGTCVVSAFRPDGPLRPWSVWAQGNGPASGALNLDVRGKIIATSDNGVVDG